MLRLLESDNGKSIIDSAIEGFAIVTTIRTWGYSSITVPLLYWVRVLTLVAYLGYSLASAFANLSLSASSRNSVTVIFSSIAAFLTSFHSSRSMLTLIEMLLVPVSVSMVPQGSFAIPFDFF